MPEKPFIIYRSSAGSGKTYILAKEYLVLALRSPEYFKNILAVTFTNKSTQEMKSRVLSVFRDMAKGDHPMMEELQEILGISAKALQTRAHEVLRQILHQYSLFSITTIDSFFQLIIRSFARDIGLQAGFKIELDEDKVLHEVLDMLMLEVGENEELTRWLIQFATYNVDDGKSWDFQYEITNLAGEIFNEHFKLFEHEILEMAGQHDKISDFVKAIQNKRNQFEGHLQQIGEEAMQLVTSRGLTVNDFAHKSAGAVAYMERLSKGEIREMKTRMINAALDPDTLVAKKSTNAALSYEVIQNGLHDKIVEAHDYYFDHKITYDSLRQAQKYLHTFGLLSHITRKLQEYRDEKELMLISDAAYFLKQILGESDAPYIYERVGNRYQHFLIDEFQDTSSFQWDNFKPLIENSLAEGHRNLVVGDVKQSIYRWRGGDWELLLQGILDDIGNAQTAISHLENNWRSQANIIRFNNAFFSIIPPILQEMLMGELKEVDPQLLEKIIPQIEKVGQAYADVVQGFGHQAADNGEGGLVRIELVDDSTRSGSWSEQVLEQLPELVERLQDHHYQLKDIAFLVRSRYEGKMIADRLLQYRATEGKAPYRYDVISSESLFLENSSVVRFLLAIFAFIYQPKDRLSLATLIYEYHTYLHPADAPLDAIFQEGTDLREELYHKWLPEEFLEQMGLWGKQPVYELTETLIRIFRLNEVSAESAYLTGFLDAVLDFSKTERGDIISFLQWWEENKTQRTVRISEEQDAMNILTIHKAKGLQFKVVIIPFCGWEFDHKGFFEHVLWCDPVEEEPFDQIDVLPLKYSSSLKHTYYSKDYYREKVKAYLDNLNLLYVAFTRARSALYVYVGDQDPPVGIKDAGDCVHHFLQSTSAALQIEVSKHFDNQERSFSLGELAEDEPLEKTDQALVIDDLHVGIWQQLITVKDRYNAHYQFSSRSTARKVEYGVLVHQLLSEIDYEKNAEKVIKSLLLNGEITSEEENELRDLMQRFFDHPTILGWYSEDWKVKTEAAIIMEEGDIRRPDRVIIKGDQAVVIDFKTGKPKKSHERQVSDYMNLLYDMGYALVEGYLLYLEDLTITEVQCQRTLLF